MEKFDYDELIKYCSNMKYSVFLFFLLLSFSGCNQEPQVKSKSSKVMAQIPMVMRIACTKEPKSFSPQKMEGVSEYSFALLLYDGLMRMDNKGNPALSLAKSVEVSNDGLTYTFQLRSAFWSDGSPLLASDFLYAWELALTQPELPAAKRFLPIQEVKALSSNRLKIQLYHPTEDFLIQLCHPTFFPRSSSWDEIHTDWEDGPAHEILSSGPFTLNQWADGNVLIFNKNIYYWDAQNVELDKIIFRVLNPKTAQILYQKGKIDWIGAPFIDFSKEFREYLKERHELHTLSPLDLSIGVRGPIKGVIADHQGILDFKGVFFDYSPVHQTTME